VKTALIYTGLAIVSIGQLSKSWEWVNSGMLLACVYLFIDIMGSRK